MTTDALFLSFASQKPADFGSRRDFAYCPKLWVYCSRMRLLENWGVTITNSLREILERKSAFAPYINIYFLKELRIETLALSIHDLPDELRIKWFCQQTGDWEGQPANDLSWNNCVDASCSLSI